MVLTVPMTLDYPWPAAAALLALAVLVATWLPFSVAPTPARVAAAVMFFVVTIWTGAHLATWRARMDGLGIVVSSPADLFRPGGAIAWREIAAATIERRSDRFRRHQLVLRALTGRTLEIPLSTLPGPQASAVAQLVAERALAAELAPDPGGFVRKAQRLGTRKAPWLALMRLHAGPQVTASTD